MFALIRPYLFAFFAITLMACDHVDEITQKKYVGLMVGHTGRLKIEIAKSLMENPGKLVPQAGDLQLSPPSGLEPLKFDFGWVTSSGAIFVESREYAVVLIQEPVATQDGIKWTCVVHPVEAKPNLCGSE